METQTIHADKIKCGGCAAAIRTALGELPGVVQVEVDVASGAVIVQGEGLNAEALRAALRAAGYPPRD